MSPRLSPLPILVSGLRGGRKAVIVEVIDEHCCMLVGIVTSGIGRSDSCLGKHMITLPWQIFPESSLQSS